MIAARVRCHIVSGRVLHWMCEAHMTWVTRCPRATPSEVRPRSLPFGAMTATEYKASNCRLVRSQIRPSLNSVSERNRIKTYGDLVTAIVNPSHNLAKGYTPSLVAQDGKSRMTVYNDVMTVSQLIDIVAFLQAHYELQPHTPTTYPNMNSAKP